MRQISLRDALNESLRYNLQHDERVFCWGEDIGVLGGAFGVTAGLIDEFGPMRIIDTPLSEIAIVGAGIGAALGGLRPVVEIMYIDFTPGCMDMIVNQMAKIHYMFGGQCKVPMVLRIVTGAMGENAAQHSQSLEAWLTGIPGLIILAPGTPYDAKGLLKAAIRSNNPVLFFENKLLYTSVGVVPEEANVYLDLSLWQNVMLTAQLFGAAPAAGPRRPAPAGPARSGRSERSEGPDPLQGASSAADAVHGPGHAAGGAFPG